MNVYLIRLADVPNNAAQNRFIGFVKGLKECGLEFQIVFLTTRPTLERSSAFKDFNVRYLWKPIHTKNALLRNYWHFLWSRFLCRLTFRSFCKSLKPDDKVIVFDDNECVHKLLEIPGVKVYIERTEHPDVENRFKKEDALKRYIEDCKKLEGIFVISTSLKKYFESVGIEPQRIHIINMTVDKSRFEGLRKETVKNRYIAYCGTILNNKDGVDLLIRSFAIAAKRIKDIKLYIIGKSPLSVDKNDNMRLVKENSLEDRIVLTGEVAASEMPQLLINAEVCVLARPDSLQAQNGFPTKLGEYLLSKNPVVITRTGDIPLFLKDGESALLCEERNIEEFAEKLCWVLEHKEEASRIGINGEQVALRHFDSIIESRKIFEVLNRKD